MLSNEMWDDYLEWLIWRCGLEKEQRFNRLFEILHNINFVFYMGRDENREIDGFDLREKYEIPDVYLDFEEDFINRECSVMEMLVALSIRVDSDIIGDPGEENPSEFFIKMLENLGLDRFEGERFKRVDVCYIVDRWLRRGFDHNGYGSPFPVKMDHRDQRKLEIWDQVNSYINENYYT